MTITCMSNTTISSSSRRKHRDLQTLRIDSRRSKLSQKWALVDRVFGTGIIPAAEFLLQFRVKMILHYIRKFSIVHLFFLTVHICFFSQLIVFNLQVSLNLYLCCQSREIGHTENNTAIIRLRSNNQTLRDLMNVVSASENLCNFSLRVLDQSM